MNKTSELVRLLLDRQRQDGGWSYRLQSSPACSWTEPTALSVLALWSAGYNANEMAEGQSWIRRNQLTNGGWAAAPGIGHSCWVTSLATLALPDQDLLSGPGDAACAWIVAQRIQETPLSIRLIQWLRHTASQADLEAGMSWLPGTSAWVAPTCMAILALRRANSVRGDLKYERRINRAQQYLLARRLPDGGWNHGGWSGPREHVASYPETTGLALVALRGLSPPQIHSSIERAEAFASSSSSAEARCWLALGLAAHRKDTYRSGPDYQHWTVPDVALSILAQTAHEKSNRLIGFVYA